MTAVVQPSGTVTLVFTDIEGSTRLLDELGVDGYRGALAEHRRIVREACARHHGYEVDYEGDALFYAFGSAAAAVAAVGEAMRDLDGGPIRIRVGIHTGEPALDPPKYVGMDVHRAARIMSSAHGGQVVLSPTTVALLEPDSFGLQELGPHRLKDLLAPVTLHQLTIDGLSSEFPPLKTLYRSNLPVPTTGFVGRERELEEVGRRLADPETRLLTLTGPGGTGKTRLALQAAAEAAEQYPDGITWVPLAPLRDPQLVLPTIANAVELSDEPGSAVETLARALAGKRALLLLDNLEHLLPDAGSAIGALIAACPTSQVLATSRERLFVQAEQEYPVDQLEHDDAISLLIARASALSARVDHDGKADELVDRLDRLPLAIELAAARLKLFTPAQLLERLGERLDMLKGARDADPRQQTLRATITWSYELLSADEQRLFRRLAVFRSAYTLAAAEAICDAGFEELQSLLEKSLVRRRDDDPEPRFWMLETIREFAAERLRASADDLPTRDAHARWFFAFAEPPDGYPWTAPTDRTDALERELDNLRAAHERLVEQVDSSRALRLAVNLFPVWEARDRIAEGDRWLERALALSGEELAAERGVALDARSATADYLGRGDDSRLYSATAVRILRLVGTPSQLAMALQGQATSMESIDLRKAVALGEEALTLARTEGEPRAVQTLALNLGAHCLELGLYERGQTLGEEALSLSRRLNDGWFVGNCLHLLAEYDLVRGNLARAWTLYLDVAEINLAERARLTLGMAIGGLAAAAARLGEGGLARRLWASFESWELERGARLQPSRRLRYETAVAGLEPAGSSTDAPLSLEEAVGLAREFHLDAVPGPNTTLTAHAIRDIIDA